MSWDINDDYYRDQLVVRTEIDNGYQLVYAKKLSLETLINNFDVNRGDLTHNGQTHQDGQLIFICVAVRIGGNTNTVSNIPVNSEDVNSPTGKHMWLVLIDDSGSELHVKRTTRQVSDAQPLIGSNTKS